MADGNDFAAFLSADENDFDAFLTSMTFAAGAVGGDFGCECDGCECGPSTVPPAIKSAVDEHQRKRKAEQPVATVFEGSKRLYIRQNRELIKREGGFSLWRLDLPVDGGDPIVEFRNSHRILFVKRLRKGSNVLSIGRGIIGSAAEENSRKRVNWEGGSSYFLPCDKGIACGWVHRLSDDAANDKDISSGDAGDTDGDGKEPPPDVADVVVYSLKVSPETLKKGTDDDEDAGLENASSSCWVQECLKLFRLCVEGFRPPSDDAGINGSDDGEDAAIGGGIALAVEESLAMELIIELAA